MLLTSLDVAESEFANRTGWAVKPQGACKGEACVPLPTEVRRGDGVLDARVLSERLGMPLVEDAAHGLWALGPETAVTGRALTTAEAPEIELPDLDGKPFRLSSLRGQNVILVAWASWCGCRTDLYLWQELRERIHPRGWEVVTVALDTGGPEHARPWVEAAKPQHPSLIDQSHLLDELLGVVNVPNVVWIDENGIIVRPAEPGWPGKTPVTDLDEHSTEVPPEHMQVVGEIRKMNIRPEQYLQMIEDWVENGAASRYVLSPEQVVERSQPRSPDLARAAAHFELGQHLHLSGNHDAAVAHWRAAHRLYPDNWTYKRQAWRFEGADTVTPSEAYDGSWLVDVRKQGAENYYPAIPDLPAPTRA